MADQVLTLDYTLAELPSAQHRAGLAGLVMMVDWLKRFGEHPGICELNSRTETGVILKINRPGLEALFGEIYAGTKGKLKSKKPFQGKEPDDTETREITDSKTGKTKTETYYIYSNVIPKARLVADLDPSGDGEDGLWVKLWRDMLWSILRGVPKTRKPFEDSADGKSIAEVQKVWKYLTKPEGKDIVDLPSTYFLGAQATNAENVPFQDRAKYQFLLHFWPYAAQVYEPVVRDKDDKLKSVGYVLVIPDVANLKKFCRKFQSSMKNVRSPAPFGENGYRPRDGVVNLALAGGLEMLRVLLEQVENLEGERSISNIESELVLGVEVVHAEKQGNSIKILETARITPKEGQIGEYARVKDAYRDSVFLEQRLRNVLAEHPWYFGFARLCAIRPSKESFGSVTFRRDARFAFSAEVEEMTTNHETDSSVEKLIYEMVNTYLKQKVEDKYGLKWKDMATEAQKKDFYEAKEKIAKDVFYGCRSKTGEDFINYFALTFGSVKQSYWLKFESYEKLAKLLYEDTEKARSLTLLAISGNT